MPSPPKPPADIQAILDVLRRREEHRVPGRFRVPLDLQRTNLSGAILVRANLSEAKLQGANLSEAKLSEAKLSGAYLVGAYLSEAVLFRANLSEVILSGADLSGANLRGADLTSTHISQHQLDQAIGDATTKLPEYRTAPASWTNRYQ